MKRYLITASVIFLAIIASGIRDLQAQQKKKVTDLKTALPSNPKPQMVYELNDAHFHMTNYVQEGLDINKCLENMGTRVGRVALFGIPLQQIWSYSNSGDFAPTYYLASDDPLYYYSFTDAFIAMAYKSLSKENQARFDPMITGFNPADMYAADHIKRVLKTFPGVFTGVGEFSIHKEFVSSKVAGPVATLNNPALDKILDFCAESGLLVILHNDINMPFPKDGQDNWDLMQFSALLKRHPKTSIIWAHCGLGRIVRPVTDQIGMLEKALVNPEVNHVNIDLSWTETAKYITSSPEALDRMAGLINKFPDRFLMGTDEVAPPDQKSYLKIMDMYQPLLVKLTPDARQKLLKGNYERLFDAAKARVRDWERLHVNEPNKIPAPTPVSGPGSDK
jgi:predicted TIM-barrel fold metal-dependent hydrolase